MVSFTDNDFVDAVRTLDTGKGPTGPGRYLAFDGVMLVGLTAFLAAEGLTWTWDDQPTESEDLWTTGWACAPTVLPKSITEELRGRLDAASGANFDHDETEWWRMGWMGAKGLNATRPWSSLSAESVR